MASGWVIAAEAGKLVTLLLVLAVLAHRTRETLMTDNNQPAGIDPDELDNSEAAEAALEVEEDARKRLHTISHPGPYDGCPHCRRGGRVNP